MNRYKIVYTFLFFIVLNSVYGQELLSLKQLDSTYTYTSLKQALENPEMVIKLELKGNKGHISPAELDKFTNLQHLTIKRSNAENIPDNISSIKSLQYLDLSNNAITVIPDDIMNCTNLKILKLGQNEIELIPASIKNLTQLISLDLWNNNISDLPKEMESMKNLKYIDLRVILLSQEKQNELQDRFPWIKMEFSYSCNCSN